MVENVAMRPKRLLVVEEVLKGQVGHWYEYVRAVVELNRAEGVDAIAVVHAAVEPEIAREIGAIPAFARSNWDNVYGRANALQSLIGVVRHNWLVYRTMRRIVRERGPIDCLFAPTVWLHHIWGWRLLMALHGSKIGRMVLLFRMNPGTSVPGSDVPVFDRSMTLLKWGMQSFAGAIARGKVVFATDSTRLARQYQMLCGISPELFPSPRIAPFDDRKKPEKQPGEPIVFSSLGPARFDKGIDLIQAAIKLCLAAGTSRPVKFVIQWNQPIRDGAGQPYLPDAALENDPRVEFIRQSLDSADYDAAIQAADCMLLPYRRDSYYARISGVAVEAATAGIPMIHTGDTWIGDLVDSVGAGVAVDDGDVGQLAAAIHAVIDNFEAFRTRAGERQPLAVAVHSSEAFQNCLWGRERQYCLSGEERPGGSEQ